MLNRPLNDSLAASPPDSLGEPVSHQIEISLSINQGALSTCQIRSTQHWDGISRSRTIEIPGDLAAAFAQILDVYGPRIATEGIITENMWTRERSIR